MLASRKQLTVELLLVLVATVWGWTFVLVKDALELYPTLPFLTLRFVLATVLIGPVGLWRWWSGDRSRRALVGGLIMGSFLAAAYVFQTFGLSLTTASNAGFITGLAVVLVPLLQGLIWRLWVRGGVLVGVGLAVVGLLLLSGAGERTDPAGDLLVLLCAGALAAHVLATARFADREDPVVLAAVQLGVVALVCAILAPVPALAGEGDFSFLRIPEAPVLFAVVITAVFASVIAFVVQTHAQRYASPTRTAIILTLEPVFAGLFGYLIAGDRMGAVGWVGAGFILVGMLVAELSPRGSARPDVAPVNGALQD